MSNYFQTITISCALLVGLSANAQKPTECDVPLRLKGNVLSVDGGRYAAITDSIKAAADLNVTTAYWFFSGGSKEFICAVKRGLANNELVDIRVNAAKYGMELTFESVNMDWGDDACFNCNYIGPNLLRVETDPSEGMGVTKMTIVQSDSLKRQYELADGTITGPGKLTLDNRTDCNARIYEDDRKNMPEGYFLHYVFKEDSLTMYWGERVMRAQQTVPYGCTDLPRLHGRVGDYLWLDMHCGSPCWAAYLLPMVNDAPPFGLLWYPVAKDDNGYVASIDPSDRGKLILRNLYRGGSSKTVELPEVCSNDGIGACIESVEFLDGKAVVKIRGESRVSEYSTRGLR